jgi:hypothetical protein
LKNKDKKSTKNKDSVIIIKPKNKNQGVDKTKMDIKSKINPNEIMINGLISANNSSVIIKCKKKMTLEKLGILLKIN